MGGISLVPRQFFPCGKKWSGNVTMGSIGMGRIGMGSIGMGGKGMGAWVELVWQHWAGLALVLVGIILSWCVGSGPGWLALGYNDFGPGWLWAGLALDQAWLALG